MTQVEEFKYLVVLYRNDRISERVTKSQQVDCAVWCSVYFYVVDVPVYWSMFVLTLVCGQELWVTIEGMSSPNEKRGGRLAGCFLRERVGSIVT